MVIGAPYTNYYVLQTLSATLKRIGFCFAFLSETIANAVQYRLALRVRARPKICFITAQRISYPARRRDWYRHPRQFGGGDLDLCQPRVLR